MSLSESRVPAAVVAQFIAPAHTSQGRLAFSRLMTLPFACYIVGIAERTVLLRKHGNQVGVLSKVIRSVLEGGRLEPCLCQQDLAVVH